MSPSLRTALVLFAGSAVASGAETALSSEEVAIGFLPSEWVVAALKKTLSPRGRFTFIQHGPVRISDEPAHLAAARAELERLRNAPAVVPIELAFVAMASRTIERTPAAPPVVDRGFPYPTRFDPPRVIMNGSGGVTVIPSQPRDFTTRGVGTGAAVNPSASGFATRQPEVRVSETSPGSTLLRRFAASAVPGKAAVVTVQARAADTAALRALALQLGAITGDEPAWASAGTELLLTPILTQDALTVNVLPQILIAPSRRIPLSACAAAVPVRSGAPSATGLLPRADAAFHRVFLGAAVADDAIVTLGVKTRVQYIGSAPK